MNITIATGNVFVELERDERGTYVPVRGFARFDLLLVSCCGIPQQDEHKEGSGEGLTVIGDEIR